MSDYGVKVSKTGVDVETASAADLIYSSKWSNFKIHSILSVSVTVTAVGGAINSATIDNPIPYSPLFMAYCQNPSTNDWYPAVGTMMMDLTTYGNSPLVSYDPATNKFTASVIGQFGTMGKVYNFKIIVFVDILTGSPSALATIDNFGMKVSKTGKAITDTDSDMSLDSKYSNLTVAFSDVISIAGGAPTGAPLYIVTGEGEVTHNLGYLPIVMVFIREPYSPTTQDLLPAWFYYGSPQDAGLAQFHVTTTKLIIDYTLPDNGDNVNFKYLIFNERFA